jgi:hypothetical protein
MGVEPMRELCPYRRPAGACLLLLLPPNRWKTPLVSQKTGLVQTLNLLVPIVDLQPPTLGSVCCHQHWLWCLTMVAPAD